MLPNLTSIRKPVSLKLVRYSATFCTRPQKSRGIQQAWMNSRNQTTIASRSKHRQLVFLHPTDGQPVLLVTGAESGACRFPPQPLHYKFSNSFTVLACIRVGSGQITEQE